MSTDTQSLNIVAGLSAPPPPPPPAVQIGAYRAISALIISPDSRLKVVC